jgi:hypothetical protein
MSTFLSKNNFIFSLLISIIVLLYLLMSVFNSKIDLVVLMHSNKETKCQVYWKTDNYEYSENNSKVKNIKSSIFETVKLPINEKYSKLTGIRFDPSIKDNNYIEVLYLVFYRKGYKPIPLSFDKVSTSNVKDFRVTNKIQLWSTNNDPMLDFKFDTLEFQIDYIFIFL